MATRTATPPEAPPAELHGADLVRAILTRKLAEATAVRDGEQARLAADPRPGELQAKFQRFHAECDDDLAAWAALDVDAALQLGLAGHDLVRQLQAGAARLREDVRQSEGRLAAIPGTIAGMTIDTIATVAHQVEGILMEVEQAPGRVWAEYRVLAGLLQKWEDEYTA